MASAVEAASPETRTKFFVSAGITDYAFSRTAPRKSGLSGATQHKESKLVPATSQIFGRCIRAKRLTVRGGFSLPIALLRRVGIGQEGPRGPVLTLGRHFLRGGRRSA